MAKRNSFTKKLIADTTSDEARFAVNGSYRVNVSGTFGGGAVAIEEKMASGEWVEVADTVKTADSDFIVDNFESNEYRFTLSGSTAPDINCSVKGNIQARPEGS